MDAGACFPPFNEPMFTAKMKSDVSQSAATGAISRKRRRAPARLISMTAGVLALLLIAAVWGWRESPALQRMIPIQGWGYAAKWTPRSVYTVDGVDKLQVFPGGEATAGSPAGAWWNLLTPIQELEGKRSAYPPFTGIRELPSRSLPRQRLPPIWLTMT